MSIAARGWPPVDSPGTACRVVYCCPVRLGKEPPVFGTRHGDSGHNEVHAGHRNGRVQIPRDGQTGGSHSITRRRGASSVHVLSHVCCMATAIGISPLLWSVPVAVSSLKEMLQSCPICRRRG